MSGNRTELRDQTQRLLDGPLKHIRGAALAAVLLPLASVAATPASAQAFCPSGGVCGIAFNDANHNGIQNAGEGGFENVRVIVMNNTGGSSRICSQVTPVTIPFPWTAEQKSRFMRWSQWGTRRRLPTLGTTTL